ncbi:MAG: RNB domain-containing ribonuclease, partial [Candidatus Latescibacteria bacterium]|nr:RNB domain-containing ribonuclease [Candidatus Latescibacterota bacterium]
TIDDAHTTDRDDGLSIQWDPDGSCRVGVHITDVASLVPGGSELDREAMNRVSSLYFPDRRIAMFPPAISEGIGSLHPDVPCLALSVGLVVTEDGSVGDVEIFPSVIRCAEKLTYEEADAVLEDSGHPFHLTLAGLRHVAQTHCGKRLRDGAISLERTERVVRVSPGGEITVDTRVRTSPANFLVSEFMIMANVAMARFCRDRGIPTVYRTQVAPDLTDLQETDNEILNRYRILRRMRPASMSEDPDPHRGLGVDLYCQASSPLRRYPDLAIQRQILAALLDAPQPYDAEGIQEVLFQADERIRDIGRLEARRERYWLYRYLERRIGETFEAVVLDSWGRGNLVEIVAYGLRTDVKPAGPVEEGDAIEVKLTRTDPWGDSIQFSHVP